MSAETIRFLCDENLDVDLVHAFRRTRPAMDILTADEAGTLHLPDPLVLTHAAKTERVLLSHDEKTMVCTTKLRQLHLERLLRPGKQRLQMREMKQL